MTLIPVKKESITIGGTGLSLYLAELVLPYDSDAFAQIYRAASEQRRAGTDCLRLEKDRKLSLGAEYLFMQACRDYGIDYASEPVVISESGKPEFKNARLHFNLSHSGNVVMCAASERPVGCDIEGERRADIKIAERFFSEPEKKLLAEAADEAERERLFFDIWTRKESFIKCIGRGLAQGLDTFSVCEDKLTKVAQFYDAAEYKLGGGIFADYSYAYCIRV